MVLPAGRGQPRPEWTAGSSRRRGGEGGCPGRATQLPPNSPDAWPGGQPLLPWLPGNNLSLSACSWEVGGVWGGAKQQQQQWQHLVYPMLERGFAPISRCRCRRSCTLTAPPRLPGAEMTCNIGPANLNTKSCPQDRTQERWGQIHRLPRADPSPAAAAAPLPHPDRTAPASWNRPWPEGQSDVLPGRPVPSHLLGRRYTLSPGYKRQRRGARTNEREGEAGTTKHAVAHEPPQGPNGSRGPGLTYAPLDASAAQASTAGSRPARPHQAPP